MPKKYSKNLNTPEPVIGLLPEDKTIVNDTEAPKVVSSGSALKKINWQSALLVILVLAVGLYAVKVRRENNLANEKLKQYQNSPQELAKQETGQLLEQLGRLIVLPVNEQPTIATVTDLAKLKGQPFFQNAQVGDRVVIYSQSRKAILFRPSENKIIEVSPFSSQSEQTLPNPVKDGTATTVKK